MCSAKIFLVLGMVLPAKNFTSAAVPQVLIDILITVARDTNIDMTITEATAGLLHLTGVDNIMIEMTHNLNEITIAAAAAAAGVGVGVGAGAAIEAVRLQKRDLQVVASPARRSLWRVWLHT